MRERAPLILTLLLTPFACTTAKAQDQQLYVVPNGAKTRWSSFENAKAEKGQGGAENKTAKGHAFEIVPPAQTRVLLDVKGAGLVQRIWMTISNRTPAVLRSARIEMY
jgi:D-arabinan exo alpha-(1,3)/(1,5)-arabinofuranosidase (non-reducing end)